MALNLQQLQKQTQRLIMTPQMQQSIQLLQLNAIELEQLAQQELLENPFLTLEEETPGGTDGAAEPVEAGREAEAEAPAEPDAEPVAAAEAPAKEPVGVESDTLSNSRVPDLDSDNGSSAAAPSETFEANDSPDGEEGTPTEIGSPTETLTPESFDQVDLNWDDYYSDSENAVYAGNTQEDLEERDFSEYVPAKTSLSDMLEWQLRCSVLEGIDIEIAEYLIGSLNEDGYLTPDSLEEAAGRFSVPREQVERVLTVIQEFDPPGIGARTLAECLLIQMKTLGSYSELARDVLENHLVEFQKKKYRELARKLNVTEEALTDLYHKICRLEPHPGRSLSTDSVQYIQPDVYVKNVDGELMIYLNEGLTRRLSVDRFYRRLLRQQRAAMTTQEKEYALEKYRAALTLIKNIEKRKSTILLVTQAIMDVQRAFLDKGIASLKPLTLREVADKVGMHESTVARVTSRKYVETPQGNFPLKFFFSSSIESQDGGEAVSSRAIKDKLQRIIGDEDTRRPWSDQKIAEMLNKEGFDIARRTVAKYREQLKILPAKYRRQT